MSIFISRFALNTYSATPYFHARCPPIYPMSRVLQHCERFHRLPPRLRELATQSRRWARRHGAIPIDIDLYYDAEGYELNPGTGQRLNPLPPTLPQGI